MAETGSVAVLPWLVAPLRRALETQTAHALLLHAPGGVGQFELGILLAQGWLCESTTVPLGERPCGICASCRLVAARSHPDLLVLLPEALREGLGWAAPESEEGGEEKAGKKKPSKDIRVEEVRAAIALALTTSSRGRGKAIVIHPAERMNAIAANAFLKTLEEPAGDARFLLCTAAADALAPTIRSRCQAIALELPATEVAVEWLRAQGIAEPEVLLAGCGGQPQDVIALAQLGVDAATWRNFPGRIAAGDVSALRGWPLPLAVDALQKLCHDVASVAAGAAPRYFAAATLAGRAPALDTLVRWSAELRRFAENAEHPWNAELTLESLVEQGREALQTPRSAQRRGGVDSLHLRR
ncbi:MAG: DNA polymerase III subunit delta' [Burkholderiales bacterium]|nr:DNA polymerase III subunit delta' [Burkholderiales bacterium]